MNLLYETPALAVSPVSALDPRADQLGDPRRRTDPADVGGDVEIGFVETQRLDVRGVVLEDRADPVRDLLVDLEPRLAEDQVRTQPHRDRRSHRRTHPEPPRFVARRRNHAPFGRAADRQRLAPQGRVVALFDAGVERIHVDMDDLAQAERFVGGIGGRVGHDGPFSASRDHRHAR